MFIDDPLSGIPGVQKMVIYPGDLSGEHTLDALEELNKGNILPEGADLTAQPPGIYVQKRGGSSLCGAPSEALFIHIKRSPARQ